MFMVLERARNTLQLSADDKPNRYLSVIENQLECCLEQSLVLRVENDAHSALRARLDVVRVALETTSKLGERWIRQNYGVAGTYSRSLPSVALDLPSMNFIGKSPS
jgi:hypothetical protein